jgi:hypothetical protein
MKDYIFITPNEEIQQNLIDLCEELAEHNNETYFIFDSHLTKKIQSLASSREEKLDMLLGKHDEILDEYKDTYHVGNKSFFGGLPSRFVYYDTETKITCRYKRNQYVVDFFKKLQFTPGQFIYGPDYEQSFYFDIPEEKIIVRVQPNCFVKIEYNNEDVFYNDFFNKSKILDAINKKSAPLFNIILRDSKLSELLN